MKEICQISHFIAYTRYTRLKYFFPFIISYLKIKFPLIKYTFRLLYPITWLVERKCASPGIKSKSLIRFSDEIPNSLLKSKNCLSFLFNPNIFAYNTFSRRSSPTLSSQACWSTLHNKSPINIIMNFLSNYPTTFAYDIIFYVKLIDLSDYSAKYEIKFSINFNMSLVQIIWSSLMPLLLSSWGHSSKLLRERYTIYLSVNSLK